jgi:hypothetical protein
LTRRPVRPGRGPDRGDRYAAAAIPASMTACNGRKGKQPRPPGRTTSSGARAGPLAGHNGSDGRGTTTMCGTSTDSERRQATEIARGSARGELTIATDADSGRRDPEVDRMVRPISGDRTDRTMRRQWAPWSGVGDDVPLGSGLLRRVPKSRNDVGPSTGGRSTSTELMSPSSSPHQRR